MSNIDLGIENEEVAGAMQKARDLPSVAETDAVHQKVGDLPSATQLASDLDALGEAAIAADEKAGVANAKAVAAQSDATSAKNYTDALTGSAIDVNRLTNAINLTSLNSTHQIADALEKGYELATQTPQIYGGSNTAALLLAISASDRVVSQSEVVIDNQLVISQSDKVISLSSVKTTMASGEAIKITGNDNILILNYDGEGSPVTCVQITGERNKIVGKISNITAAVGMVNTHLGGVDNRGIDTTIDIEASNFINTGFSGSELNESYPHAVSFQGGSVGGTAKVKVRGGVAGVVCAVCTKPKIELLDAEGLEDNGIYVLETCDTATVGTLRYEGEEEAWVNKANLFIDLWQAVNHKFPAGIQNCGKTVVNAVELITTDFDSVKAAKTPLIQTRSGNTSSDSVVINNVVGDTYGNNILQFSTGAVKHVAVKNCDITHHYHNALQLKTLYSHASGESVDLENNRIKVIDDTATLGASDTFTITVPTVLTKPSRYANNSLTKEGGQRIRVINAGQPSVSLIGLPPMEVSVGPYIREDEYLTSNKIIRASATPSVGAWAAGDVVIKNNNPSQRCSVAGTPGEWVDI